MNKERIIQAAELLLNVIAEEAPNCPLCGEKMFLDLDFCENDVRLFNEDADSPDEISYTYLCDGCYECDMKMNILLESDESK
jgi:hypothetical protein